MKRLFSARACGIWAAALALATVVHRLLLASHQFILATDTGTLALMALDILDGERPLFLYGFSYAGAPMAYLTALSFRLFGISLFTLVLPTALLAGLWVWLSWLLFKRLAGPRAGLAAALIFAFPDRLTSWYTHTPYNSYGAFLALGTLILWLAVEIEARAFIAVPLPLCRAIAWVMEHTMARPPLTRYAISRIEHEAATDNTEAQDDLGIRFRGVTEGLRQCLGAGDS